MDYYEQAETLRPVGNDDAILRWDTCARFLNRIPHLEPEKRRPEPDGDSSVIRQIAYFEPHGLGGLLYWYLLWPIHEVMFRGMLRRIAALVLKPAARAEEHLLQQGR